MPSTTLSTFIDDGSPFWIIILYNSSMHPGSEFEIKNVREIVPNSSTSMERGSKIEVFCGSVTYSGTVVTVSQDYSFLVANFAAIIDSFLADRTEELSDLTNVRRLSHEEFEYEKENLMRLRRSYASSPTSSRSETDSPRPPAAAATILPTDFSQTVQIGSGGTTIRMCDFRMINWTCYRMATRRLLSVLFTRETLATHTLSGKPSPAFSTPTRLVKQRLNAVIVQDIIEAVVTNSLANESLVRSVITTKCADENKLFRKRMEKMLRESKENVEVEKKHAIGQGQSEKQEESTMVNDDNKTILTKKMRAKSLARTNARNLSTTSEDSSDSDVPPKKAQKLSVNYVLKKSSDLCKK